MKYNINDKIRVRLTPFGLICRSKIVGHELILKIDSEGYMHTQIWELASYFGVFLYNGAEQLFEKNEIFIGEGF